MIMSSPEYIVDGQLEHNAEHCNHQILFKTIRSLYNNACSGLSLIYVSATNYTDEHILVTLADLPGCCLKYRKHVGPWKEFLFSLGVYISADLRRETHTEHIISKPVSRYIYQNC